MKYYDLNGNLIDQDEFIQTYKERYFKNYVNNTKDLESIIDGLIIKGAVNIQAIAWKFGRSIDEYSEEDDSILNGYGKPVYGIVDYLQFIEDNRNAVQDLICRDIVSKNDISQAFQLLRDRAPDNFGTVYIITVMYFLSKGNIPIYDQFAHKAVKAIYFEKKPMDIYVGPAPSKESINDAVNLLMEYMWYIEEIFGRHDISRSEDQALWAYGHVKHKTE